MFLYVGIMVAFLGVSMVKFKTKKDRRVTLVLCLLVLLVLMAFKGATVGNDTPSYIRIYNNFKLENVWYNPEHRFEIGYQILCKLVIIFFDHHQFVFIFSAIICCFCLYKGLKSNSENIGFSLFLFVALRIFYFYLSGIRQAVAMSIIFMSYNQIKNKQYFKFVILVLIASTFHFFALTFLIAIPLSFMKFNVKNVCVILAGTLIFFVAFNYLLGLMLLILPDYYSVYLQSEQFAGNNLANYVAVCIKACFILLAMLSSYPTKQKLIIKREKLKPTDKDLQMNMMLITLCISILAIRASVLDRIEGFFWIFSIITIPSIIRKSKGQERRALYIVISILLIAYNVITLVFRPEWNTVVPYVFFWE